VTRRVTQAADQAAGETSAQLAPFPRGSRSKPALAKPREIPFDPQKRAAAPELKASIEALGARLEAQEWQGGHRVRKRSPAQRKAFMLALEAIACNLAWLIIAAPGRAIAVPRDNNLMRGKSRYKPEVYGLAFVELLDLMARPELGLIENVQRGFKVENRSQPSLIRPLPAFAEQVPLASLTWEAFIRLPPREVLILKSGKDDDGNAQPVAYDNTARIRTMRNAVVRLNKRLQAMSIILKVAPGEVLLNHDGLPIDPTRRALRRIFNNGSWYDGGRLFDGFWETMPKAMRFRYLRLPNEEDPEGEPVANVDFEQLFPHLAYHKVRIEPPAGDLYDIEGNGANRQGWKRLLNAQFFARGPLKAWPRGCREEFESAPSLKQACAMLEERHRPIAHLFGQGVGFHFMFQESSALIEALGYLHAEGITALPLHDSVLVPRSRAARAMELLQVALERCIDKPRAAVSIDYGPDLKGE
jgi:hypothetical protein